MIVVGIGLITSFFLAGRLDSRATNGDDPGGFNVPKLEATDDGSSTNVAGPKDKTLELTVPAMACIENDEIPTAVGTDEQTLKTHAAIHLEGTNFPWQREAKETSLGPPRPAKREGRPATVRGASQRFQTRTGGRIAHHGWRTRWRVPRPGRVALVLFGFALVIFSVVAIPRELQSPEGESAAATAREDRTLSLTVPEMKRVRNVPVFDGAADDKSALRNGALHVKDTGFPWQREANVYIAGHRLGYPRTKSFLVFWDLNELRRGDRVVLKDSEGTRYAYKVFDRLVVPPERVSVKEPIAGKNIVSLQTCTLPDYSQRLIVRAELVSTRKTKVYGP